MSHLLRVFPNDAVPEAIDYCDGVHLYTRSGDKILDLTGGATSHMIMGWNHPEINDAILNQLHRYSHIDYKAWTDPACEALADLLLSKAEHKLDKVYFCGNSGGEACEAAMKMSYQWHYDQGLKDKIWFISRRQSYHGSSSDALSLGDRPNLEMYRPLLPPRRAHIDEHNPVRHKRPEESLEQYAIRSANSLEEKIIELGADNVAAFIGETMMGGLIGDVPPAPGYWRRIREICTKYNVHLIMDEVYCGTGTSGKVFCCDWDQVTPDFLFLGKTLAAGYAPISAVVTSSAFENILKSGQGRLQHSTTHQAYSLGIAAALKVQQLIQAPNFLDHVNELGQFVKDKLTDSLGRHRYFVDVRGRGLRISLEHNAPNQNEFSQTVSRNLLNKYKLYVSGKWHRFSFTPALTILRPELEFALDKFADEFIKVASFLPDGCYE